MTQSLITHLRHVDLAIPDFERQLAFYTRTWGLTTSPATRASPSSPPRARPSGTSSGCARTRASASTWSPSARRARRTWTRSPGSSSGAASRSPPSRASLGTEGGGYGLRFFDLDGRTVEVSADVATRQHRKIEERESIPVRLSHVVLNSTDPDATARWYSDTLGFRLSDTLAGPETGTVMNFMRCNPRHHSVAFARGPHVSLHHVSFELRGIDEFMRGTGRVLRSGTRMVWGPGRHLAGANTFAYFLDPQNNTIEYTTELAELDEDTWHPHIYDMHDDQVQDQWGTANPMNELVARESFNDPDPGPVHRRRRSELREESHQPSTERVRLTSSAHPGTMPGACLPSSLPRACQIPDETRETCRRSAILNLTRNQRQHPQQQCRRRHSMRAVQTGGIAALALAAGLGLAACSSGSSSSSSAAPASSAATSAAAAASSATASATGGSSSTVAAGKCGTIPTTLPSDPDGVLAALPASVSSLYNGYPVPRLQERVRQLEANVRLQQDRRLPAVGDQQRLPAGAAADPVRHAQVRRVHRGPGDFLRRGDRPGRRLQPDG